MEAKETNPECAASKKRVAELEQENAELRLAFEKACKSHGICPAEKNISYNEETCDENCGKCISNYFLTEAREELEGKNDEK